MARQHHSYACSNCHYKTAKPLGRCPECGSWNTFEWVEESKAKKSHLGGGYGGLGETALVSLKDIGRSEQGRHFTGIPEFDRVLGGGLVAGGVALLGGEPGIGKSTLLLQVAHHLAKQGGKVLYIAGEESLEQIRLRADRLGVDSEIWFSRDTRAASIAEQLRDPALLCIVDSIQTIQVADEGNPGSPNQVREATALLTKAAKEHATAMILVGHVTKEGGVAGPKVMEHIVDTTLFLESVGPYRLLRSAKNRFGSVGELGVFEMREAGLFGVDNPSAAFLSERPIGMPGSVVTATLDGVRPLLLEVQALAAKTPYPNPRRIVVGLDARRVDVVLAVLERRIDLPLSSLDIYINLAGGMRVHDPGIDLAVALSVYSAVVGKAISPKTVVFGEVGLAGEVRTVNASARRLEEALRSNYTEQIAPLGSSATCEVKSVQEALSILGGASKHLETDPRPKRP